MKEELEDTQFEPGLFVKLPVDGHREFFTAFEPSGGEAEEVGRIEGLRVDEDGPWGARDDQNNFPGSFAVERITKSGIGAFRATQDQRPAERRPVLLDEIGIVREVLCRPASFPHQNLLCRSSFPRQGKLQSRGRSDPSISPVTLTGISVRITGDDPVVEKCVSSGYEEFVDFSGRF